MKKNLLLAACALALALPAGAIEVLNNAGLAASARHNGQAAARSNTALHAQPSELPEPEVFAMMLLGLILIGYRASRDSTEKFK